MYQCFICSEIVNFLDIKYHTADKTKIFCGASCSLTYYQQLKEKEDGKDEI